MESARKRIRCTSVLAYPTFIRYRLPLVKVALYLVAFHCVSAASMVRGADAKLAPPDFAALRKQMIERQLKAPGRDITNQRVLEAMATVPRHEFVPEESRHAAYADGPLRIGYDQTISQPFIVAFMTERLDPKPADRVLEIGTGSGYQAAVLSRLVAEVYTIEIVAPLGRRAESDLKRLGYTNVTVRVGDGHKGWPEAAPFDVIIVTCAPEHVPRPLIDQLKDGGRMIIPVGPWHDQQLYLLAKRGQKVERQAILPVRFVPMTGTAEKK
jgi:protein-L-isoaspartate(D-aspartate) O-methyltransferase